MLTKSLALARNLIENGETNASTIYQEMLSLINDEPLANVDYISIVDSDNLGAKENIKGSILIALAVYIGKTRLIDNIIIDV